MDCLMKALKYFPYQTWQNLKDTCERVSEKAQTSYNNEFTHRRTSRLGQGTGRKNPTEWQHDTSFLLTASRLANHTSRVIEQFKVNGRREHDNVI